MARVKGDGGTLDLFAWEPPRLVQRFDETRVRATLRARIARAVSLTLKECGMPREEVARRMAEWLGEEVSKNSLDAYASESREDHSISFLRLLAITHATNDSRLLQLGAELFGRSVICDRYLPWVEVGQLADRKEDIDRAFDAARRLARRTVKP